MRRLLLAVLFLMGTSEFASPAAPAPRECRLKLYNTHSGEHLNVVYKRDGVYDLEALAKLVALNLACSRSWAAFE